MRVVDYDTAGGVNHGAPVCEYAGIGNSPTEAHDRSTLAIQFTARARRDGTIIVLEPATRVVVNDADICDAASGEVVNETGVDDGTAQVGNDPRVDHGAPVVDDPAGVIGDVALDDEGTEVGNGGGVVEFAVASNCEASANGNDEADCCAGTRNRANGVFAPPSSNYRANLIEVRKTCRHQPEWCESQH